MIVKITNESKKWMTVYELEQAKIIIQQFNEDDSMADLCQIAARIASKSVYDGFEILRSSAKIARNCRIQNMYHENSGDLDVWIKCYVFNDCIGFYDIGAYYSDLVQYDGTEETAERIRSNMYIREFKEG